MPNFRNVSQSCVRHFAHIVLLTVAALPLSVSAQTLNTLVSFTQTDGLEPVGPIAQDSAGNIYGTNLYGGANGYGEVYKVAPDGALTVLHSFCSLSNCSDGGNPFGGLILATDGNIYGTTLGTVYRITPSGDFTTIYTFCSLPSCADGQAAYAPLLQGSDGNFYGATQLGGVAHLECGGACGTIFRLTSAGVLTTLHNFGGKDGYYPQFALLQGADGNLYGTATRGGIHGLGAAFRITPSGTFTLLHNFTQVEGWYASLNLQATNGNFYGITEFYGAANGGTAFQMTSSGKVTLLRSFNSSTGTLPTSLVPGHNGNFFGTTADPQGTLFELTLSGDLTTLYKFCSLSNCADGEAPTALLPSSSGMLYGATAAGGGSSCDIVGGTSSCGTVFSFRP